MKCRDINWERERLRCYGGEGALFAEREQREKERGEKKAVCWVCLRKTLLQNH